MVNRIMRRLAQTGAEMERASKDTELVSVQYTGARSEWWGPIELKPNEWTFVPRALAVRLSRLPGYNIADPALRGKADAFRFQERTEFRCGDQLRRTGKNALLSIIVLGCNQSAFTRRCLQSIVDCTKTRFELIFVDNGSTDDTRKVVKAFKGVRYVFSGVNLGVARGRNLGLSVATGDVLCFLDNDIEVSPEWDIPFIAALKADPQLGMLGTHGSVRTPGNEFTSLPYERQGVTRTDYVRGQCQVFPVEVLRIVGNIDSGMEWHEDSEFSGRIRTAGLKVGVLPVPMVHGDGTTAKAVRGKDFMRRSEVDLHYLRHRLAAENIAWVHREICADGEKCVHSLCSITDNLTLGLREWGFATVRRPTVGHDYTPLLLSSACHLSIRGVRIGTYHVENDRVAQRYVSGFDVDYNLCGSRHMAAAFKASGIPSEKLIPCDLNSVDTDMFYPPARGNRGRKGPFRLLWVGASQPRKGVDVVLAAFEKAFGPEDDVVLVLKDGAYGQRANTEAMIAQCKLKAKVEYIWKDVPAEGLAELYRASAFDKGAFVHPHRGEGFGRTPLEAVLCGCRVGATGWGGPMDYLDTKYASLFPYKLVPSTFHNNADEAYFAPGEDAPMWAEPDVDAVAEWMQAVYKTKCNTSLLQCAAEAAARRYNHETVRYQIIDKILPLIGEATDDAEMYDERYWETGEFSNYTGYAESQLHADQAAMLVKLFKLKGKKVLDVGAGPGYLVKNLRALGVDAYGVDISAYAVDRSPVRDYMFCADVGAIGVPQEGYDFIFSLDCLEHVAPERLRFVLGSMYRALRAGGQVCLIPGTIDCETLHSDRTHKIFRSVEWWGREIAHFFEPTDTDWTAKIYKALPFAAHWRWHPYVGRK